MSTFGNNDAKKINATLTSDLYINVGVPSVGTGVAGPRGDKGYSAYEIAVRNGYTGTEAEWLKSLKGTIVSADTDSSGNMTLTDINGNTITTALKPIVEAKGYAEAAKTSETNAKTSETNAKTSETNAKTSETNAKTSEENAAESARQAAHGQINADWNETNADSMAYIKNKPDVLLKSGGTMTGPIKYVDNGKVFTIGKSVTGNVALGWSWDNREGAGLGLRSTDYSSSPCEFSLFARDSANSCSLIGKPDGYLTWNGQPLLPVGIVQAFAGTTIPNGWLLCDGSAVSRTNYASLFSVIGTTYGSGNGSTTFNLPNLVDKFVEGSAKAGTIKSAGLPNITGSIGGGTGSGGTAGHGSGVGFLRDSVISGCFQPSANQYGGETGSGGQTLPSGYPVLTANLDASRSSSVYGKSTTVQPPALTMRYIIKY